MQTDVYKKKYCLWTSCITKFSECDVWFEELNVYLSFGTVYCAVVEKDSCSIDRVIYLAHIVMRQSTVTWPILETVYFSVGQYFPLSQMSPMSRITEFLWKLKLGKLEHEIFILKYANLWLVVCLVNITYLSSDPN